MKTLLLTLLLFCSQVSLSQSMLSEEEKIENLVRVWGLLKYQHPEVSRGKFDMNREFIEQVEKLQDIKTREEYNTQLLGWVKSFGTEDLEPKKDWKKKEGLFSKNADFGWIEESEFDLELEELLQEIRYNINYKDHYASLSFWRKAVEFDKDLPLDNFDAGNKAHRLLFLAHFWNAMNYWNVNVYLTDTSWSQVLQEIIPQFSKEDALAFDSTKDKLFSRLNDSHSNYYTSKSLNSLSYYPDFGGRLINDSLVVTRYFNGGLAKIDNISVGDIIYSVEGRDLKSWYTEKFSEAISVSNSNYLKTMLESSFLLASDKDSIRVGVFRKNHATGEQFIRLSKLEHWRERYTRIQPDKVPSRRLLSEDIGYLNLNSITKSELKSAFKDWKETKGIILDLRNYPRNISHSSLPKYLYPRKEQFVEVLTPELPGFGKPDTRARISFLMDPFRAGRRNKNYYKGQVVLLVDRNTLSNAEWIGMAIQAGPNVVTTGEQTGGALLNRNGIKLMDGTSIDFTSAGAFYPGGDNAQRQGLKIDLEIREKARDYNKNQYLEKAVEIIEN